MLLILSRREGHVPLKILSVEDGATLHRPNHLLETLTLALAATPTLALTLALALALTLAPALTLTLLRFNHLLHRTKKVEFIEQFSQKLLVKQEGEALQIVDVQVRVRVRVRG